MHGSGEIVLAFSTANQVPRETRKMVYRMKILLDQRLDPLYEAVIEATEEAILNALCMARDMDGVNGNVSRALPLADVKELVRPLAGGERPAGCHAAFPTSSARLPARGWPGRRNAAGVTCGAAAVLYSAPPLAGVGPRRPSTGSGRRGGGTAPVKWEIEWRTRRASTSA